MQNKPDKDNDILNNRTSKSPKNSNINTYKNDVKKTLEDPMQSFHISRLEEHKKSLLKTDSEAIKKIKNLLKNIRIEKDANKRTITLNLKNKYTIIEPNLDKISDEEYKKEIDVYKIEPAFTHYVSTRWNRWNISHRSNKSLKKYAQEMRKDWYNIPTENETNNILNEIWEMTGIDKKDLMDIFVYLTGLRGNFLLQSSQKNNIWEKTINLWTFSWYESVDWDYPIKLFFLRKW